MKKELENIKAIMDLFLSQNGEPVDPKKLEWELDFRSHLLSEIEKALAEQREELVKRIKMRLRYCQDQNGKVYCKNCGLCEEDLENLTPQV